MEDDLKKAWRSQTAPQRLTLDAGLVLDEVRRNEQQFAAMIYCRDLREIGVALVMIPVWFYLGHKQSLPWSWYAVVPALVWIAAFMTLDRRRQRPHRPEPGDTLRRSVEKSLAQVEHQIWLLRNVLWWYLLPIYVGLLVWPAHHAWRTRDGGWETLAGFGGVTLTYTLVFGFIHWLNQYAVRKQLEPRRRELQALLQSLNESGEASSH